MDKQLEQCRKVIRQKISQGLGFDPWTVPDGQLCLNDWKVIGELIDAAINAAFLTGQECTMSEPDVGKKRDILSHPAIKLFRDSEPITGKSFGLN